MNLHCFGANLPWQLLTFSILQQHTSAAASSTLHIIYVFHTISSSSYLTLEGTPLKLVYFFGYPFSTRADSFEQLRAYFGISISQLKEPVPQARFQEVQGSYSRKKNRTKLLNTLYLADMIVFLLHL